MNKNEKWEELLNNLLSSALAEHNETFEQEYLSKLKEQIYELMDSNVSPSLKPIMEETLYELDLYAKHETEFCYHQGMKDCVFMLKSLGVLS